MLRTSSSSRVTSLVKQAGTVQVRKACPACLHSTPRRHLSRSTPAELPRVAPRFKQPSTSSAWPAAPTEEVHTDTVDGDGGELPWFLESEEVERPPPPSALPAYSLMQPAPPAAAVSLPPTLDALYTHLTRGAASGLLARPDSAHDPGWEEDPGVERRPPITLIPARAIAPEDAWSDWIAVVQVRGAVGGAVRKVALEVGNFLKHQPPPRPMQRVLEEQAPPSAPPSLDDILGAPEPARPQREGKHDEAEQDAEPMAQRQRPAGMSRIEWAAGRRMPEWEVQKHALSAKLTASHAQTADTDTASRPSWRPSRILSREAQNGLRLVHASDPARFSAAQLAARFRISVESVRRILRAGKWEAPQGVEARQNRRARERVEVWREALVRHARRALDQGDDTQGTSIEWRAREDAETQRITDEILGVVQGEVDEGGQDEGDAAGDDIGDAHAHAHAHADAHAHVYQPVSYEGLVDPSAPSGSSRSSSAARSPLARGDGDWCLVDADWIVVHVLTADARAKWGLEEPWERRVEEAHGAVGTEEEEEEEQEIRSPSRLASRASLNSTRYRMGRGRRR